MRTITDIPWHGKPILESYISKQLNEYGRIVEMILPDYNDLPNEAMSQFQPGYADIELLFDTFPPRLDTAIALLKELLITPSEATRIAAYEMLQKVHVGIHIVPFLEKLLKNADVHRLHQEGLWLLNNAAHREVVKVALYILGNTNCNAIAERLYALAHHEEFTRAAIYAIQKGTSNISKERLWQLYEKLSGIGKIYVLKATSINSYEQAKKIHHSLWPQKLYPYYPVLSIMQQLEMEKIAAQPFISEVQYEEMNKLLVLLLCPYVRTDFAKFVSCQYVMLHYIRHSKLHCKTLQHMYPIVMMGVILLQEERVWAHLYTEGWSSQLRSELQLAVDQFLRQPRWAELVEQQLEQLDAQLQVAFLKYFQLDYTDWAFIQLRNAPFDLPYYDMIFATNNPKKIEVLGELMLAQIDVDFTTRQQLVAFMHYINFLNTCHGIGLKVLRFALRQQRIDIQMLALYTLLKWDNEALAQPQIILPLEALDEHNTDPQVQELIHAVLARAYEKG